MKAPKITSVERTWVEVPFKPRHVKHLTRGELGLDRR